MLKIEVRNGNIDAALKAFKGKAKRTKLIHKLREGQNFMSKSEKKRLSKAKAKYKQYLKDLED